MKITGTWTKFAYSANVDINIINLITRKSFRFILRLRNVGADDMTNFLSDNES